MQTQNKFDKLHEILKGYGSLAVAFSGGVDSTFLLAFAKETLGSKLLAITAAAPAFSAEEQEEAAAFCAASGIPQIKLLLAWEDLAGFAENPPNRCYLCKRSLFTRMKTEAAARGFSVLADGTNADDLSDYRPGIKALEELEIASPLREAGLTKEEIRSWLREKNMKICNKPAFACLASRVPYGEPITPEKLAAIDALEQALRRFGFAQVRVRHHGAVARIEVLPEDRERFFSIELMDAVNEAAKKAGFLYAALDLGGYKTGNLNQLR